MNYRRIYWLLFLGAALLFGLVNLLDYLEAGQASTGIVLSLLLAVVIVGVSTYAAAFPERVGGPDELGPRFALAVVAFLLFVVLAVLRLASG